MSKVMIATPTYHGDLRVEFVAQLMKINGDSCPGHTFMIQFVNGDGVARARNNIVKIFLDSPCDEIVFWDADIDGTPEHLARLLSHDLDVVGGLYPIKEKKLRWVATAIEGEEADPKTGLQKVLEVGTGFQRIRRQVIQDVWDAYPEDEYFDDGKTYTNEKDSLRHDIFKMGVVHDPLFGIPKRRYLSEDYYSQYLFRKLGYDIYADCFIQLKHIGQAVYPIEMPEKAPIQEIIPQ